MIQRLRWKDLALGLLGLAVIVALGVAIVTYGSGDRLHGRTIHLYVTTDQARGVATGTEVWVDGQKVGLVRAVSFRPPSSPPAERIVLALEVRAGAQSQIRRDSRIALESGANILGDQVVEFQTGSPASPVVRDGDTIHAAPQTDVEVAASRAAGAMRDVPGILDTVKLLATQARSAATLFASLARSGTGSAGRLVGSTQELVTTIERGAGTTGLALEHENDVMARVAHAMASADSILALLGSSDRGLGRFRRDSTLPRQITRVRDELAAADSLVARPAATARRAAMDSTLQRGVARDLASMDSLLVDLKRHPFRYIVF